MKKIIVALITLMFASSVFAEHADSKYLQMAYNYQINDNETISTIINKLQPETKSIITYNEKIVDTVYVRLILQSKYGADLIIIVEYDLKHVDNKSAKLSVKAKFNGEQKTYYGDNAKKVLMILSSGDDDEL